MPIVTRTVAKVIAPRVHSPGPSNAKHKAARDSTRSAQHHHKRKGGVSEESVSEVSGSDVDDENLKHIWNWKKHAKRQRREPSNSDVEVILSDTKHAAPSEEVVDEPNPGDKVSRKPLTKEH
jgi:hypothetical protein